MGKSIEITGLKSETKKKLTEIFIILEKYR